jgi:hypothetical protein
MGPRTCYDKGVLCEQDLFPNTEPSLNNQPYTYIEAQDQNLKL